MLVHMTNDKTRGKVRKYLFLLKGSEKCLLFMRGTMHSSHSGDIYWNTRQHRKTPSNRMTQIMLNVCTIWQIKSSSYEGCGVSLYIPTWCTWLIFFAISSSNWWNPENMYCGCRNGKVEDFRKWKCSGLSGCDSGPWLGFLLTRAGAGNCIKISLLPSPKHPCPPAEHQSRV